MGFESKTSYKKLLEEGAKNEKESRFADLKNRVDNYKIQWDKDGVIQFKNDRIAILKRGFGAQVEFIIAFDDLTKEGYHLMAIDEGKEAGAGNITGGVNSYYYFQKIDSIK